MKGLSYSIILATVGLVVEAIALVWALNQYKLITFGDDRLEYWLNDIVVMIVVLALLTAIGLLLQIFAYRRLVAAE